MANEDKRQYEAINNELMGNSDYNAWYASQSRDLTPELKGVVEQVCQKSEYNADPVRFTKFVVTARLDEKVRALTGAPVPNREAVKQSVRDVLTSNKKTIDDLTRDLGTARTDATNARRDATDASGAYAAVDKAYDRLLDSYHGLAVLMFEYIAHEDRDWKDVSDIVGPGTPTA